MTEAATREDAAAPGVVPVRRALLSVSDKAGLLGLARALAAGGAEILSTGGSAGLLRDAGVAVTEVAEVTGVPEMLGGRVKTLHPRVHGGLLGRRDDPGHLAEMAAHGIRPIDLLVVNLYPFEATRDRGAPWDEMVEEIDVGGPAMIRAAAKNHAHVAVLTDPADYGDLLAELAARGGTTAALRRRLAALAFARTAAYDAAIAAWMAGDDPAPRRKTLSGTLVAALRYGENPHQRAALYATDEPGPSVVAARQAQGKVLSYNNVADADAALALAGDLAALGPACAIVKHAVPCGAAVAPTLALAYERALASDPTSAFGGIVALSRPLDGPTAEAVARLFTEVVVAPGADDEALAVMGRTPNLRLLLTDGMPDPSGPGLDWKRVAGGFLVQDRDAAPADPSGWVPATRRQATESEVADLVVAWIVARHARSNAIVLARDGATVGIGAGQTSRVDAVRQALARAGEAARGAALASDAFFPFADGIALAAQAGVATAVAPSGSVRDAEVVAAAEAGGIALLHAPTRHFRH